MKDVKMVITQVHIPIIAVGHQFTAIIAKHPGIDLLLGVDFLRRHPRSTSQLLNGSLQGINNIILSLTQDLASVKWGPSSRTIPHPHSLKLHQRNPDHPGRVL